MVSPDDDIAHNLNTRCHLVLKVSTWQRDSHELFDYESPNLRRKNFDVHAPASLTRNKNDEVGQISQQEVVRQNHLKDPIPENLDPILSVNVNRGGFYSLFDQVHTIDKRFRDLVYHREAPTRAQKRQRRKA